MTEKHLILCGGAKLSSRNKAWRESKPIRLELGKGEKQLHLRLHHITRRLASQIPAIAIDLLEIATYVYAADQMVSRGGLKEFEYGTKWRRQFRLEIPVRLPDKWNDPKMISLLQETIGFLSDDDYEFHFTSFKTPPNVDRYLFDTLEVDDAGFEEVILFSGGLDSFGGAVQEIIQGQRKVVLVSHRPVSKIYARQKGLVKDLVDHLGKKSIAPMHVAIEVNKTKNFGRDFTQRSRSFLFAALAAAVALSLNRNRIRFYENGVISLNIPLSPQALGGRATRTTHPRVLNGFEEIFSLAFDKRFAVENPYLWKTKADILREIKAIGLAKLCARTSSCTHTKEQTHMHTHCGYCSQCVDRRLNALAAGFTNEEDPAEMYSSDVVFGEREEADLTMIERYLGTCLELDRLGSPEGLLVAYPEIARVLRQLRLPPSQAADEVFKLLKRHARDICGTVENIVSSSSAKVVRKDYPPRSLLGIAVGRVSQASKPAAPALIEHRTNDTGHASTNGAVLFNDETFSVVFQGKSCELRNTKEYAFIKRISKRPGTYVSLDELRASVWQDEHVEKNTVQRVVSNLRRQLESVGLVNLEIDGKTNRHHYALKIKA